ncbi:putative Agenet domain-containing protein / bromo-adjacent domain-containing protein [Quillaja saponaria]|uniref:Agenet domain-containing protein / bromo-adjacent domain-containing protein n=1 Tax=Quillaja saponaria TaxID=32244 RepID=A0AAD7PNA8_QUISA|nr:putative Agenet domain-containing protein / bromo-adjacent domain-containing protein [Quillaja saponaria]
MTGKDHCFVEWKEEFISQERGNRVVHYFLKDSAGESTLAVVGTERSVRHMFYVVAEEFLELYGNEGPIRAGFKWRSRREVVDWLTSMLSKQHLQGDEIKSPSHDTTQALRSFACPMNVVRAPQAQILDDKGHLISNLKRYNTGIMWSGVAWKCGKQLKHYPGFYRNGTTIAIQSFVFVMAKGENHYIAYLEDMYEDRRGQKKVKVRWFHHNKEVKGVTSLRNPHPREVFITSYSQVISAECVDGLTTVLTREHYEKFSPAFPPSLSDRVYLCSRQFRNNRVKQFDLSKLRGYFDQPILSCLVHDTSPKHESIFHSLTAQEDEDLSAGDNVKLGAKRMRNGRESPKIWKDHQGFRKLSRKGHQKMLHETDQNLSYAQAARRLLSLKEIHCQPWYYSIYKVDDKIEVLCLDSGIRGCWFRCTVLQISRKRMKVQYDDVQDEDGCGNLEEWVPTVKLAMCDKLGMRHLGRPTIRPAPSDDELGVLELEVGTAVDAWWSDGWWEGVVIGVDNCNDCNMQVYFPGESLLMNMHQKDLRISRDWLGDRWIDVEAKPDVVSAIFAVHDSNTNLTMSTTSNKDVDTVGCAISCPGVSVSNNVEEKKLDVTAIACSDNCPEDMDWVEGNKSPLPKEKGSEGHSVGNINGRCDDEENDEEDNDKCSSDYAAAADDEDNDNDKGEIVSGSSGQDYKAVERMEVAV